MFLGKFTLMRLLFSGALPWCAFGDCFSVKIFLGKSHTHEASLLNGLPWCAFEDCLFLKIYFGKTHTHEASLSGGLMWCASGDDLSLKIYFGKTHTLMSTQVLLHCTVEWESCSESGFWHAKLKGFMPANIGFSFRAIKLWYSSNMWWQNIAFCCKSR